jgi:hypothetical protein
MIVGLLLLIVFLLLVKLAWMYRFWIKMTQLSELYLSLEDQLDVIDVRIDRIFEVVKNAPSSSGLDTRPSTVD